MHEHNAAAKSLRLCCSTARICRQANAPGSAQPPVLGQPWPRPACTAPRSPRAALLWRSLRKSLTWETVGKKDPFEHWKWSIFNFFPLKVIMNPFFFFFFNSFYFCCSLKWWGVVLKWYWDCGLSPNCFNEKPPKSWDGLQELSVGHTCTHGAHELLKQCWVCLLSIIPCCCVCKRRVYLHVQGLARWQWLGCRVLRTAKLLHVCVIVFCSPYRWRRLSLKTEQSTCWKES